MPSIPLRELRGAVLVLLAYAGFSFACFAQPPGGLAGALRPIHMEAGGWVTGYALSADGRVVYARTDVGGLYRSDDAGASWRFLSGAMRSPGGLIVAGVLVDPRDANVVLQAVGTSYLPRDPSRGIWRSSDGGATWRHVLRRVNHGGNDRARWGGEVLARDPRDADRVYAGTRDKGLWRSTDAGETWSELAPFVVFGGSVDTIALHPARPGEIWVGGGAGVFRSRDGGASFQERLSRARFPEVFRILVKADGTAFVAAGRALLRLGADGSEADLTQAFDAGERPAGELTALAFVDGREDRLLASRLGGPTRESTDDGASFGTPRVLGVAGAYPKHAMPYPTLVWGRNAFVQDPRDHRVWWLSGDRGALRSRDGGLTYEHRTKGMSITVAYRASFHPTDPHTVYLPLSDWVGARLDDGGRGGFVADYARLVLAAGGAHRDHVISNATHVLVSPARPSRAFWIGGSIYDSPLGRDHGALIVTEDAGRSYRVLEGKGLPDGPGTVLVDGAVSRTDADKLVVLVQGNARARGAYVSDDAGRTFTRATGLRGAVDGHFTPSNALVADPFAPARRLVWIRGGGLFQSSDEGRTWGALASFGRRRKALRATLVADELTRERFYLALTDGRGAAGGLFRSDDGGARWKRVGGFRSAAHVDARGAVIAISGWRGRAGISTYVSRDGGRRFSRITPDTLRLPNVSALRIDPHAPNRIFLSTNGLGVHVYEMKEAERTPSSSTARPPAEPPRHSSAPAPREPALAPPPSPPSTPSSAPPSPGMDASTVSSRPSCARAARDPAGPAPIPAAAEVLRSDPPDVESLVRAIADPSTDRGAALRLLAGAGGPRSVEGLIASLSDAEPLFRLEAVTALGRLSTARAIEGLAGAVRDASRAVRIAVLRALAGAPSDRAVEGILSALLDTEVDVRLDAIRALSGRAEARATEGLIGALSDARRVVRLAAVEALARRPGDRAIEGLVLALRDAAPQARRIAIGALGERGGARACDALRDAVPHLDNASKRHAEAALRALTSARP